MKISLTYLRDSLAESLDRAGLRLAHARAGGPPTRALHPQRAPGASPGLVGRAGGAAGGCPGVGSPTTASIATEVF